MTAQQKIELKRSEIRQRLGAIAELQGDDVTDDITTERDGLMGELRNSEGQLQAAIEAEATETRGASAVERLDDGEGVEYRGLVERSKLSAYVLESHRQGGLDGRGIGAPGGLSSETDREAWTRALGGRFCRGARPAVDSRKGWTPTRTSRSTLAGRKRRSWEGSLQTRLRRSWAFGWRPWRVVLLRIL